MLGGNWTDPVCQLKLNSLVVFKYSLAYFYAFYIVHYLGIINVNNSDVFHFLATHLTKKPYICLGIKNMCISFITCKYMFHLVI